MNKRLTSMLVLALCLVMVVRTTTVVTAAVVPLDIAGTEVVPKQVEVNVTVENTQPEETSERTNQTTNTTNNR
mgnify:CR=1 FL=1